MIGPTLKQVSRLQAGLHMSEGTIKAGLGDDLVVRAHCPV